MHWTTRKPVRVLLSTLGLILIAAALDGESGQLMGGHSAKSALPNVILGFVALFVGSKAKVVAIALGIVLLAFGLLAGRVPQKHK